MTAEEEGGAVDSGAVDSGTRSAAAAAERAEPLEPERAIEVAERVLGAVEGVVLGQRRPAEELLVAYMAGGHALVEGVPGLGKTLLARTFAACLGVELKRIQFTPDLMPADVLGSNVWDRRADVFRLVRGPVFTRVLMADEINRTPPKTQAALLEAMQELQVTIDGISHVLDEDFFVVATQNPLEFEGVYPLPEAQLDRFLLKVEMDLPPAERELELLRQAAAGRIAWGGPHRELPAPVVEPAEVPRLRRAGEAVRVTEEVLGYLAQLAAAVRRSPHLELGPSPRGALALLATGRAAALLEGRDFVVPDDLKRSLAPCWRHRVLLSAESELEGHSVERVLAAAADSVEVPH